MRTLLWIAAAAALLLLFLLIRGDPAARRASEERTVPPKREAHTPQPETAAAPPTASAPEQKTPVPPDATASATLTGTVVHADGTPVPEAIVRAWQWDGVDWSHGQAPLRETTTDHRGAFTLPELHGNLIVTAAAEGLVCREALTGRLPPTEATRGATIVMDAPHTWSGRVVDANGQPVPNALLRTRTVEILGRPRPSAVPGLAVKTPTALRVHSDSDGRFTIGPLPHGAWTLSTDHPDFAPAIQRLPTDKDFLEIRLESGVTVDGIVRRWDGTPAAGVAVDAHAMGPTRTVTTAADGSFSVRGLRDGPLLYLKVRAPFAARHIHEVLRGQRRGIEISLARPRTLSGEVVDENGRALSGIRVRVESKRKLSRGFGGRSPRPVTALFGGLTAVTDSKGRFQFERLFPDRYTVIASDPANPHQRVSAAFDAGNENARLVFVRKEETIVSGIVRDAESGETVPRFEVTVRARHRGAGGTLAVESKDGRFRWAGKAIPELRLTVKAEGYVAWTEAWTQAGFGERRYDIRLHRPASLRLRAVDPRGERLTEELGVLFEWPDGRPVLPTQASGITLQDGEWSGHGLPRGPLRIVLVTPIVDNTHTRWTFDVDLSDGIEGVREIVVDPADGEQRKR